MEPDASRGAGWRYLLRMMMLKIQELCCFGNWLIK
jgi:hypothetical protein